MLDTSSLSDVVDDILEDIKNNNVVPIVGPELAWSETHQLSLSSFIASKVVHSYSSNDYKEYCSWLQGRISHRKDLVTHKVYSGLRKPKAFRPDDRFGNLVGPAGTRRDLLATIKKFCLSDSDLWTTEYSPFMGGAIKTLAEMNAFPVIISLISDPSIEILLARADRTPRCFSYCPTVSPEEQKLEDALRSDRINTRTPVLLKLFGDCNDIETQGSWFPATEDDLTEFIYNLTGGVKWSKTVSTYIRGKRLLFLGSALGDAYMRLLVRFFHQEDFDRNTDRLCTSSIYFIEERKEFETFLRYQNAHVVSRGYLSRFLAQLSSSFPPPPHRPKSRSPEQIFDVYIAYSRRDETEARLVVEHFGKSGLRVFYDRDNLPFSEREAIIEDIIRYRSCIFVPLFQKSTYFNDHSFMRKEMEFAKMREADSPRRYIYPMALSNTSPFSRSDNDQGALALHIAVGLDPKKYGWCCIDHGELSLEKWISEISNEVNRCAQTTPGHHHYRRE